MITEPWFTILLIVAVVWSTIWKGFAMWKACKKDKLNWFIVFLFLNTLGILEILYLYVFSECKCCNDKCSAKPKKKAKK